MHNTPVPLWFSTLIREGLASLHCLNLEGYPAVDVVAITTNFWVNDLWSSSKREWHMEADEPCIRIAFKRLRNECHRWPAPAKFWEVLPQRAPPKDTLIPAKVFTLEERRENLRRLKEMGEELLGLKSEDKAS